MNLKIWISLLAAVLLGVRCSSFSNSHESVPASSQLPLEDTGAKGSIVENRSKIIGAIVRSVPHEGSKFFLKIRIEEVVSMPGFRSFAQTGKEIEVYPNFIRREGQAIDYNIPENEKMLEAGNLKPGDKITAIIYLQGDERKRSWLLMSWDHK